MAEIHIRRDHHLGMAEARKVAWRWAEEAEQDFDMNCTYEEGRSCDEVHFSRSGVNGILKVTRDHFELDAKLGFLLGAFKDRIESEIVRNLDDLLKEKKPKPATKVATGGRKK